MNIRGAKGGGQQAAHVPVEARDSLRSKAYARIVDLVSEGEIDGLVNGLKSIYLDDTAVQAVDGTMNFSGVTVYTRQGVQGQTHIPGFSSVENSASVGVEVKYGVPFVRSFTTANLDALRITVGVPILSSQDPTNGDTNGANVALQFELQTNGGGFVPVYAGVDVVQMNWDGTVLSSQGTASTTFSVSTNWLYPISQSATYKLQYRLIGGTTWSDIRTATLTRDSLLESTQVYSGVDHCEFTLPSAAYEFRAVLISGDGLLECSGSLQVKSYTVNISGKTTTRYQRSVRIPVSGSGPWDVRVTRLTADSTTTYLQNKTYIDTVTEIIDAKMRYPNSAYVALSCDASQFTSIPKRSYHIKGIRVRVPSNYDPAERTYTGVWDGTFKIAWTDNPAWCFYDLLTSSRYGLGDFVPSTHVDKWALYTIGKYCDEFVPDGFGGTEPRFTCNLYLQTRAEAYKVINDFASIFRGLVYWASSSIVAVQDAPSDPAYLYTPANVIDGMFNYMGASAKARHTVALVTWNDPADLYRQQVEYVEDAAGIERYGIVSTEVLAFGCASRGQAHRVGKWLLFTERLQSEVVTFKTGMDGNLARPGQIIKIADPARAGVRLGGRLAAATTTTATLDAPVTLAPATTYTLSVLKSDGTVMESTVTTAAGTVSAVTFSPAFPEAPAVGSIWVLASASVDAQLFKVISVSEADDAEFEISALAHEPGKFDLIENDVALTPRSISLIGTKPKPPENGVISETLYEAATDLKTVATFSWDAVDTAQSYVVSYKRDQGNYIDMPQTSVPSCQLFDAQPGLYAVSVWAVNALGVRSAPLVFDGTVLGKVAPPADVTGLQIQVQTGSGLISWDTHPDLDVKLGGKIVIRHSKALVGAQWSTSVPIAEFSGAATTGTVPLLNGTYLAKAEDTSGSQSINATSVATTAPSVLQYNAVVASYQNPSFSGTKTGVEVSGSSLVLAATTQFDAIPDLDAMVGSFDGGTVESGEYIFSAPIDIGAVYSCRVTIDLGVTTYDTSNIIDNWGSVDGVTDVDGAIAGDSAEVKLYISTTQDNPSGAPTWSPYRLFTVGDYLARGYRFKLTMSRGALETQQVSVNNLGIIIDVPDRVEGKNGVAVPAALTHISFNAEFFQTPAIAVTGESLATGDYFTLTNKTAAGFDVQFFNSSGTSVARTMDWIAKGYGYKT